MPAEQSSLSAVDKAVIAITEVDINGAPAYTPYAAIAAIGSALAVSRAVDNLPVFNANGAPQETAVTHQAAAEPSHLESVATTGSALLTGALVFYGIHAALKRRAHQLYQRQTN